MSRGKLMLEMALANETQRLEQTSNLAISENEIILNEALLHDVIIEGSVNTAIIEENGAESSTFHVLEQDTLGTDSESDFTPSHTTYSSDTNQSDAGSSVEEEYLNIATENEGQEDSDDEIPAKKKAKYRITRDLRYKNKELRMRGEAYHSLSKDVHGKYQFEKEIGPRKLGPTCVAEFCKKSKVFFCSTFDEADRKVIFEKFWKTLTWDMKHIYMSTLVDYVPSKRKKEDSRRNGTLIYQLKKGTEKVRVCKRMFLSTLGVKEWTVRECSKKLLGIHEAESNIKMIRRNRQSNDTRRRVLKMFLEELPKMPSHYCRASTSKLYLEPTFQSKNDLYREYKKFCAEKNEIALSLQVMKTEIEKMNIKIYRPRKDQCDLCLSHKLGNIDDLTYQNHQENKNQARMSKEMDKQLCRETPNEIAVFTVDVQAVKLAPMLKASAIYYKTKLSVHNYTIYNLNNGEVTCHLWDESQGGLEANIFASLLIAFLQEYLLKNSDTKQITIYSDGCGYQNKNATISNALLKFSIDNQVNIYQKYFEKGHSQMEVDSVHSKIENRLKNRDIYLPTDYIAVCREACIKNPYNVKYMDFSDFNDFSQVRYYASVRPGIKTGDPQVNDVHCFAYLPEGSIQFKLSYTDDWISLPKRAKLQEYPVTRLYKGRQKIKPEKYNHLQQLKPVLDRQFWEFYDNLPH